MFYQNLRLTPVLLTTFFGISLLFFSGCPVRPCEQELTYHDLPASARAWVPYDNVQSFQMKHSGGAVTTFTQTDSESRYDEVSACPECCTEDMVETATWAYSGSNPSISLFLSLSRDWEYGYQLGRSSLSLTLNSNYVRLYELDVDSLEPLNASSFQVLDTVVVQGVSYPGVHRFIRESGGTQVFLDTLWYQKATGILKFSMSSGENWELMP